MIEREIVLAGANNWTDALVADFVEGQQGEPGGSTRFLMVPHLMWLDAAIAGTAVLRFFYAPGAGAAAENQSLLYLSQAAESGMQLQCGEGLPIWRDLAGNLDPWTLRVTSTAKSGNGRVRAGYTYKVIAP